MSMITGADALESGEGPTAVSAPAPPAADAAHAKRSEFGLLVRHISRQLSRSHSKVEPEVGGTQLSETGARANGENESYEIKVERASEQVMKLTKTTGVNNRDVLIEVSEMSAPYLPREPNGQLTTLHLNPSGGAAIPRGTREERRARSS